MRVRGVIWRVRLPMLMPRTFEPQPLVFGRVRKWQLSTLPRMLGAQPELENFPVEVGFR